MKILLVEEYAERERIPLLLLKHFAEARGHSCGLTDSWELERAFRTFAPDVVVDNVSDSPAHFVGKLGMLSRRHRNINLIWEQIPNPMNVSRYRFGPLMRSRFVDGRVSWGLPFKDILLLENPGMDPHRIGVVGSIKQAATTMFQSFPKESFHQFFDYPFQDYDRSVLVAEAFAVGSLNDDQLMDGQWKGRHVPYLYEYAVYARAMRDAFTELVRRLSHDFPDVLFIVRTHPGKDPEYYRSYEASFEVGNVRVNTSGDIAILLHVTDLMIGSRSGALLDAYFANRPAVNLALPDHPSVRIGVIDTLENAFGHTIPVGDLTSDRFDAVFGIEARSEEQRRLVGDWFEPVGSDTFERLVDFVEAISERPALPKRLPLRAYTTPPVVKRKARNMLRSRGLGIRSRPARLHPYEAVVDLLVAGSQEQGKR